MLLAQAKTVPTKYVVYKSGLEVTITGTNFGATPKVYIGSEKVIDTFKFNDLTTLTFDFPSLPTGSYAL